MNSDMKSKVRATLEQLGASGDLVEQRSLPLFAEATELEIAHISANGREHLLVPEAAVAWRDMSHSAAEEGITLLVISR